jgi:hypothetical protein
MKTAHESCTCRQVAHQTPARHLKQSLARSIVLIVSTLFAAACRNAQIPELTVKDFLGPEPGKTYLYEGEEELRVEVVGTDRLSPTRIRVRETATLHAVEGNEASSTTSYDISAVDGQLVQENTRGRDILLQEPIRDRARPWQINLDVGGQSYKERRPLPATCHVTSVKDSVVIAMKVPVVTVACVSESALVKNLVSTPGPAADHSASNRASNIALN